MRLLLAAAGAAGLLGRAALAAEESCAGEPPDPRRSQAPGTRAKSLLQLPPGRSLAQLGPGRVGRTPARSTAVVMQAYGEFSEWQQSVLARYVSQAAGSGIQVAMLRDVSYLQSSEHVNEPTVPTLLHVGSLNIEALGPPTAATMPSGNAVVQRSVLRLGGSAAAGPAVPVCEVTWSAARREFGGEELDVKGVSPHHFHGPFQVLWWRYCAQDVSYPERVWLVEPDAYFTGNAADFIGAYADDESDLIASGFRIIGSHWWKWRYVAGSSLDIPGDQALRSTSQVVSNVPVLPNSLQGHCKGNEGETDDEGVLFRQDHVERLSGRLLESLNRSLDAGLLLPSEVWEPTVCAYQLHGAEDCTMLDFAPLLDAAGEDSLPTNESWISGTYCWFPEYQYASCEHCDGCQTAEAWADKWVHPVKTDDGGAMDCMRCCNRSWNARLFRSAAARVWSGLLFHVGVPAVAALLLSPPRP